MRGGEENRMNHVTSPEKIEVRFTLLLFLSLIFANKPQNNPAY